MNKRKKILTRGAQALALLAVTGLCFLGVRGMSDITSGDIEANSPYTQEEYLENVQNEKLLELEEAEGFYSEDSIVLNDTTKEQAEIIAEKIGGKLRLTEDGSYAVIYLPENVSIEDVYVDEEYRGFLEEMTPDYYVSISAIDANNNELFSARPEYSVNDTEYSNQQYLDYINIKDAWNVSKGSGVRVAVIDTGERVIIMSS